MTAPTVADLVELDVGAVAAGGSCVARHDGRVVFVRHALPGERVRARLTDVSHPRFWRADAVEVLAASPDRVASPCPHAGPSLCGGCDWQHASLPAQRALKAQLVRDQLRRAAGPAVAVVEGVTVEELPGTPDGLGWRTRVRYAVGPDGGLGLRRHRSNELEPVGPDGCRIAHPRVVAATPQAGTGSEIEVVAAPGSGDVAVVTYPDDGARAPDPVRLGAAGRTFVADPRVFWQVHPAAADVLVDAVRAALGARPGEVALDLYAGAGLFASALAGDVGPAGRVIAVESDPRAVEAARVSLADLPQVSLRGVRVGPGLLRHLPEDPGVVVLDPPRAGAGTDVIRALLVRRPRVVAYVSCDPATLARDLAAAGDMGYRLAALRAFDLFPMTAHVECLATLTPDPAAGD